MPKWSPIVVMATGGLLVLLLGWFGWPTPYRYDKMGGVQPVRTSRLTGQAELLTSGGWTPMAMPRPTRTPIERGWTAEDLAHLDGTIQYADNSLRAWIHNGTKYHLKSIDVELRWPGTKQQARRYALAMPDGPRGALRGRVL